MFFDFDEQEVKRRKYFQHLNNFSFGAGAVIMLVEFSDTDNPDFKKWTHRFLVQGTTSKRACAWSKKRKFPDLPMTRLLLSMLQVRKIIEMVTCVAKLSSNHTKNDVPVSFNWKPKRLFVSTVRRTMFRQCRDGGVSRHRNIHNNWC